MGTEKMEYIKGVFPRIDLLKKLEADRKALIGIGDMVEVAQVSQMIVKLKREIYATR